MRYGLIGGLLLCLVGGSYWAIAGETSVVVTVLDEQGAPVADAEVQSGWGVPPPSGFGLDYTHRKGLTEADGTCTLPLGGRVDAGVGAGKAGYYGAGMKLEKLLPNPVLALNHPAVTISLLKKLRPVSMYVRKVLPDGTGRIPLLGETCGFDLMQCAWVKPHGLGEVSDFTVLANLAYRGERDYDFFCTITFASNRDGIQLMPQLPNKRTTSLRLPREAPEDGFRNKWTIQGVLGKGPLIHALPGEPNDPGGIRIHDDDNFIFRVRSRDDDGIGPRCMSGKIHGPINVEVLPWYPKPDQQIYLGLEFIYYLNPDGTNSLEWNGHNLFGDLPAKEWFRPEP